MKQPERTLIDRLQHGDRKAFDQLFHRYRQASLNFCTVLLKDANEAENIVQEAFARIWESKDRLDPDRKFTAYLFTIVRNMAFDYFKRVKKDRELKKQLWSNLQDFHQPPQNSEKPKDLLINEMISSLPPKRRKIISLIMEHGKSHKEIAEEMNISVNTVKNQMVQAKKYLQKNLKPTSF